MRKIYAAAVLAVALTLMGVASAQRPEQDIDPRRHPNLAEAQHHIAQAIESARRGEREHEGQFGGHAGKSIEYMRLADQELKEAAEYYNHNHR
jgi:hypothetical protein